MPIYIFWIWIWILYFRKEMKWGKAFPKLTHWSNNFIQRKAFVTLLEDAFYWEIQPFWLRYISFSQWFMKKGFSLSLLSFCIFVTHWGGELKHLLVPGCWCFYRVGAGLLLLLVSQNICGCWWVGNLPKSQPPKWKHFVEWQEYLPILGYSKWCVPKW